MCFARPKHTGGEEGLPHASRGYREGGREARRAAFPCPIARTCFPNYRRIAGVCSTRWEDSGGEEGLLHATV
jgi:hypothetical protein